MPRLEAGAGGNLSVLCNSEKNVEFSVSIHGERKRVEKQKGEGTEAVGGTE